MILTRKILAPLFILFAALIIGLFAYVYFDFQTETAIDNERDRTESTIDFHNDVEHQKALALSLALEAANDPAIQSAFASLDREKLLQLTQPGFEKFKENNVTHYNFYLPSAITFLRLDEPQSFGDDVTSFRPIVAQAGKTRQPLAGLEADEHGLAVHALAPVFYETKFIGTIEIGIAYNEAHLNKLKTTYGNDWRILISAQAVSAIHSTEPTQMTEGPVEELTIYASTMNQPVFNSPAGYIAALNGNASSLSLKSQNRNYFIVTDPIASYDGTIIGTLDTIHDKTDDVSSQVTRLLTVALVGAFFLALAALILITRTRRALNPIQNLTSAATQIAGGDFSLEIRPQSKDEIGILANVFNDMASRLRDLVQGLEERVMERTKALELRSFQLETIAQVARDIATVRDLDTLLILTARLIQERFGYYHTGVFLIDEKGEYAVLRAASSRAAQAMLDEGHKLKVGEKGIVGYVANTGLPRIAQDVGADAVHFRNPHLPETRAEIGLPLRSRGLTIGVLDIQAVDPYAFSQENIETLQLLADQLVSAIENAQLVQQVESTLSELKASYQARTRQSWKNVIQDREQTSLEYDGLQIKPITRPLPINIIHQLENGKAVVLEKYDQSPNVLVVPLMVLNQLIGVIGLEQENPNHIWTEEEIALAQTSADRAAIALENARLLNEAQQRAVKEQTISEMVTKIGNTINMRNVLQTAVEELGRALPGSEVIIRIGENNNHKAGDKP